jgi:hypothetical protein
MGGKKKQRFETFRPPSSNKNPENNPINQIKKQLSAKNKKIRKDLSKHSKFPQHLPS